MIELPVTGTTKGRTGASSPVLLGLLGLVGFAVLLEVLPRIGVLPAEYFPPTSEIGSALVDQFRRPEFWLAFRQTLTTWITGLSIAYVAGVVLGAGHRVGAAAPAADCVDHRVPAANPVASR